ncbi:MAG: cation-translocating P-type ATPase [Halovenus sp.]
MTDDAACAFCGEPVVRPVSDGESAFCSDGCRQVAAELGGGRDDAGSGGTRVGPDACDDSQQRGDGERDDHDDSRRATAYLQVDGMHCATCETFLERVATRQDAVESAAASYVTETVRVTYDPLEVTEDELCEYLTTLGYRAQTRGGDDELRPDERGIDDLLGFRYAAGVVFGTFMLLPYIIVLYPAQVPSVFGRYMPLYTAGTDGLLLLPPFVFMTGVVLVFTGLPLLRGAYVSLALRQPNTDLLVTTTITAAYVYGIGAFAFGHLEVYFDLTVVVAATVVAAIFYESLVKQRAMDRLTDLTVSQVETARRADGESVPVEDVAADDLLLVREGERIPVDGVLAEGTCRVDEAVVTGESLPVRKTAGDELVGGSVVTGDAALLRAGDPPTSSIDRLTTSVWNIQSADHGRQHQTDRVAAVVVPVVVVLAALAGVGSLVMTGSPETAVFLTLTAVLALCPWALGLSTPLSVATSIRDALERGIVVFDETVFERLRETDVVVFDKTGTLTTGNMAVLETSAPGELLEAAAALESRAAHPAGVAIAAAFGTGRDPGDDGRTAPDSPAPDGGPTAPRVESFRTHGNGVSGTVDGREVLVGNVAHFETQGWTVPPSVVARAAAAREAGDLPVLVGAGGTAAGVIVVGDETRNGWEKTFDRLANRGVDVVVLTGDGKQAAAAFLSHPGVDHVLAEVPPAGKTAAVRRLQDRGHVTMVGDGTNDAPALAAADLGVALGSGTALASEAADIAIVDDDLESVDTAFDLASAARRRLTQNTALGLLYNVVAVPLAAVGLLNPLFAMGAVVLSGGLLGLNANRDLL